MFKKKYQELKGNASPNVSKSFILIISMYYYVYYFKI